MLLKAIRLARFMAALSLLLGIVRPALAQTPVPPPRGVQATAGPVTREGVTVEVVWQPVVGATSYEVERAAVGKPPLYDWALVGTVRDGESARYADQIWAPRGRYCYRVRAISGSGRSEGSEEACVLFGIIDYPPYAPDTGSGLALPAATSPSAVPGTTPARDGGWAPVGTVAPLVAAGLSLGVLLTLAAARLTSMERRRNDSHG